VSTSYDPLAFWYTGWLLTFLATGDQTQGRFALIEALTRKGNCPPRHIHRNEHSSLLSDPLLRKRLRFLRL
jgi:hypothetical protein